VAEPWKFTPHTTIEHVPDRHQGHTVFGSRAFGVTAPELKSALRAQQDCAMQRSVKPL
jgi:hypothetical protein